MDGWSDRDGRGTDRRAYPPEPRWRRFRVDKRHMARGTCRREKACKKLLTPLQVKRGAPPSPNSQGTRILPQPVCFWGCRSCRVPAARARGEKVF